MNLRSTKSVGPQPCDYLIVSDYAGKHENAQGVPLVGKTGEEVTRRLDGVDLPHRSDIRITNLIRQWNPSGEYSESDVERDENLLIEELIYTNPKVIITLGRFSVRWCLGDVGMDEVHSLPWKLYTCEKCLRNRIENGSKNISRERLTDAGFGSGLYLTADMGVSYSLSLEENKSTHDTHTEQHTDYIKVKSGKDYKSTISVGTRNASTPITLKRQHRSKTQDDGVSREHTVKTGTSLQKRIPTQSRQLKHREDNAKHATPSTNGKVQIVCNHRELVERCVVPIYNPAAGFRSPEVQARVDGGFKELALYLAGKIEPRELFKDEFPEPRYLQVVDDASWIQAALKGVKAIYVDSEGYPDDIWSVQFCVHPGTAYLIRLNQEKAMRAFFEWMLEEKPVVTYHGSLHDFGIMRQIMVTLGLDINKLYDVPFGDTQIMAYLLQLEPIGLKPNCVRHCNMRMQDYDEVLGDAQITLAHEYLIKIFDAEKAKYRAAQAEEFERINRTPLRDAAGKPKRDKQGQIKYRKTTVRPKLPMSDLMKAAKRVLRSETPYKLWQEQREDILVQAYNTEV